MSTNMPTTAPPNSTSAVERPAFLELPDLASSRLGGVAVAANDEFFAPRESLLYQQAAVWDEHRYTERGKWMDGWETRRRREPGHDWCLIRLGVPGVVRGVVIDTAFFRGNYPESAAIQGCTLPGSPDTASLLAATWHEVLPRSPLAGNQQNQFAVEVPYRFTHLRLEIFPDGGVARFRVHGEPLPEPAELARRGGELDLAALELGATVPVCSDMFFGSRQNLILPGRSTHMGDGWETRRRRGPGNDWTVVRLCAEGLVRRVELDTSHFKGNAPGWVGLETLRRAGDAVTAPSDESGGAWLESDEWHELLPRTATLIDTVHVFRDELAPAVPATHVRLSIYPDGGVARLRLWGQLSPAGAESLGLRYLAALPPADRQAAFARCSAAPGWVAGMNALAPFASRATLHAAADEVWWGLAKSEWLAAFAAHPRIGERKPVAAWSASEQAGMSAADAVIRADIAARNVDYERHFGYVFLINATGKTAAEMLAALERRLTHDPDHELRVAAAEQAEIARIRLDKLLGLRT